jgi:adenosine/AMP kinase
VSGRVHEAALAVTMDGTLLVGVAHFEGERGPEEIFRQALEQRGDIFIGIAMNEAEASRTLMRLDNASRELAAFVIGERQRRRQPRAAGRRSSR